MSNTYDISDILKIATIGIDRNIIVYDADAKSGIPTSRLVALMKVVDKRNNLLQKKLITHLVIPIDFTTNFEFSANSLHNVIDVTDETTILGLKTIVLPPVELDSRHEVNLIMNHFNQSGGSLAANDTNLLIAFNGNKTVDKMLPEDVLLGSY